MDWQQATALGIVGATVAMFVAARFRRKKQKWPGAPAGGCCPGTSDLGIKSSIRVSGRKGERPKVTVKMKGLS